MIKSSEVGFLTVFFPLVSMVTTALRDFPQETNQREKERIGREKRAKKGKEKARRVHGCSIFSFEGQKSG